MSKTLKQTFEKGKEVVKKGGKTIGQAFVIGSLLINLQSCNSSDSKPTYSYEPPQIELTDVDKNTTQQLFASLEQVVHKVQKEIELTGDIDEEARQDRGIIEVKSTGQTISIGSYNTYTHAYLKDSTTLTILGGRGHDLDFDITDHTPEEIIKFINIINSIIHYSIGNYVKQSKENHGIYGRAKKILLNTESIENVGISIDGFIAYINERNYAPKVEIQHTEK